jgi:hypothetical protein
MEYTIWESHVMQSHYYETVARVWWSAIDHVTFSESDQI